jgi:hypothetical protein
MVRSAIASIALAGALLIPATHALAAPVNAPSASTIDLRCDNGQAYTVVTNSGRSGQSAQGNANAFDPGFIVDGGFGKLLPLSFTFTGTDPSNGTILFSQTVTKGQAAHATGSVVTCSFDMGTFPLPSGGTGQFSGTVAALLR